MRRVCQSEDGGGEELKLYDGRFCTYFRISLGTIRGAFPDASTSSKRSNREVVDLKQYVTVSLRSCKLSLASGKMEMCLIDVCGAKVWKT